MTKTRTTRLGGWKTRGKGRGTESLPGSTSTSVPSNSTSHPSTPYYTFLPPRAVYIRKWREDEGLECDEERRRTRCPWADDETDVDVEGEFADAASDESDEDESEEVKLLKSKRRELLCLFRSGNTPSSAPVSSARVRLRRVPWTSPSKLTSLHVVPGYSALVIDTNILLFSLSIFASLVETLRWTTLIPSQSSRSWMALQLTTRPWKMRRRLPSNTSICTCGHILDLWCRRIRATTLGTQHPERTGRVSLGVMGKECGRLDPPRCHLARRPLD